MAFRLLSKLPRVTRFSRGIMTTQVELEKVQEDLQKNPYFEKYAQKIAQFRKENPEEFQSKLKDLVDKKKKPVSRSPSPEPVKAHFARQNSLSDIMKVELLEGKRGDEISKIWHEYHRRLDCISNVLNGDTFKLMRENANTYPTFIVPVPRTKGYEFFMLFFSNNEVHFTPLAKYQEIGPNAPECLTIKYYDELLESKNIVLMRGTYDKSILSNLEANCLSSSLQLYYGDPTGKRAKYLHIFTNDPEKFDHMLLITDFEAYSNSVLPASS